MNQRVKELRKSLGMTLREFGKRLGVSDAAISRIEKGERNLTEQMTLSICREFNINEKWLRTGNGEMRKLSGDKLSFYLGQINAGDDEFIKDIIEVYMELDTTSKKALKEVADRMIKKRRSREKN